MSHHDLSQDEHNDIGGLAAGDGIEKLWTKYKEINQNCFSWVLNIINASQKLNSSKTMLQLLKKIISSLYTGWTNTPKHTYSNIWPFPLKW